MFVGRIGAWVVLRIVVVSVDGGQVLLVIGLATSCTTAALYNSHSTLVAPPPATALASHSADFHRKKAGIDNPLIFSDSTSTLVVPYQLLVILRTELFSALSFLWKGDPPRCPSNTWHLRLPYLS